MIWENAHQKYFYMIMLLVVGELFDTMASLSEDLALSTYVTVGNLLFES